MQAGQIVGERNPRGELNSKDGIVFNSHARSGVKPVPKIALQLDRVTEIVAIRRSLGSREACEATFVLITECEESRKMPVKRVVGLAEDEVPV